MCLCQSRKPNVRSYISARPTVPLAAAGQPGDRCDRREHPKPESWRARTAPSHAIRHHDRASRPTPKMLPSNSPQSYLKRKPVSSTPSSTRRGGVGVTAGGGSQAMRSAAPVSLGIGRRPQKSSWLRSPRGRRRQLSITIWASLSRRRQSLCQAANRAIGR